MQRLTKLTYEEQKSRLFKEREEAWAKTKAIGSIGSEVINFLKIGDNSIQNLFNTVIETEEKALSSEYAPKVDINYFVVLADELTNMMQVEYNTLRTLGVRRYERIPGMKAAVIDRIAQSLNLETESIIRRVETIQEKLKLGLIKQSFGAIINIGGDVGVVNTGTVYGAIHSKIEKNIASEHAKLSEALNIILDEIDKSNIDHKNKLIQMQNIEFLIEQYKAPQEQKNPGLLTASLTFLATASNLTTVWSQFGPTITDYFNNFFLM